MAELHRLNRRTFLNDFGKGSFAIAFLGAGVLVGCADDGTIVPATSNAEADASTVPDGTASSSTVTDDIAPDVAGARWERVELGSVSAYLIARGNEVAIVDTGLPGNIDKFDAGLSAVGAGWGDVKHVILTHRHGDHTGGLPEIIEVAAQSKIHIGEGDIAALAGIAALPINDGDEVFGLEIIGTPGHTPGHISVLDAQASFLVAGDAINESDGVILGPNARFTSDMGQANASVRRLAERSFETVVFGHGNPFSGGASDAVVALAQTL